MAINHQRFQYTSSNFSDFIEFTSLLQSIYVPIFAAECLKIKLLIDIWTILCRILGEKNPQVCIYSLIDVSMGHCVELTFLGGKLGRFLKLTFIIWILKKKTYCILNVKVREYSIKMRFVIRLQDIPPAALREVQFGVYYF